MRARLYSPANIYAHLDLYVYYYVPHLKLHCFSIKINIYDCACIKNVSLDYINFADSIYIYIYTNMHISLADFAI